METTKRFIENRLSKDQTQKKGTFDETNVRENINEAQLMLLQLFENQALTKKQLVSLRKTLLHFLVEQMDAEAEQVLKHKQTTAPKLYEQDSNTSRTERLAQIRSRSK